MAKGKSNETKGKSNRGGSRPNAGRKPKAVTELKQALISELAPPTGDPRTDAAEYAFRLFEKTMRDEKGASLDLRLECGREVMNRVWGKPMQAVKHSGDDGAPLKVIVEYADDQGHLATPAPRPTSDLA